MPVPISLIVDDSCPLIHLLRYHLADVHGKAPTTADGRELPETIPNEFLERFCDVCEARGIYGKFSIVPSPAGRGNVAQGIEGYNPALTHLWIAVVQSRMRGRFDFCPEGITHDMAVNLETNEYFDQNENDWSQTQTRETLTPYLTLELQILKAAGIDATGFTSPWVFGMESEPEYVAAMVAAQKAVFGRDFSWYFLHMRHDDPTARPWVAYKEGETTLVSIPSTVDDFMWRTIDSPRTDAEYVSGIADMILSEDGKSGKVREILDAGGYPILLTHWQSLFSAGLETGLAALDEAGRRIQNALGDEVEWMPFMPLARKVADESE
jgi:hypothetical protein